MIGRLIEQKYVRTAKQQLRKFDTHTPTEITCGQIYDYKVKYDEFVVLRKERRE